MDIKTEAMETTPRDVKSGQTLEKKHVMHCKYIVRKNLFYFLKYSYKFQIHYCVSGKNDCVHLVTKY